MRTETSSTSEDASLSYLEHSNYLRASYTSKRVEYTGYTYSLPVSNYHLLEDSDNSIHSYNADISTSDTNESFENLSTRSIENILLESIRIIGAKNYFMKLMDGSLFYDMENVQSVVKKEANRMLKELKRFEVGLGDTGFDSGESYLDYQWTKRFNDAIKEKNDMNLITVSTDFTSTVEKVAKIIILEKNLPVYLKTIKPRDIGGKAGGIKYVTHGVLFKFAEDFELAPNLWLYGQNKQNNHLAASAMSNEIRALQAMFHFLRDEQIENLNIPIMCSLSYLGLTICGCSLLPITNETIVYGSYNAGKTIYEGNDEVLGIVKNISNHFNFAKHPVVDGKGETKNLYLAADLEFHLVDGQYYILDFGRFFPSNNENNVFVNLFRREFMIKYKEKLSPDAFSNFGRTNSEIWNKKSIVAISQIPDLVQDFLDSLSYHQCTQENIGTLFHSYGINIRFLGLARSMIIENTSISHIFLIEMILRSVKIIFKRTLETTLATQIVPIEYKYREAIVNLYSNFDQPSNWSRVKDVVTSKFGAYALRVEEETNLFHFIQEHISKKDLINKMIPKYCRFKGGLFNYNTQILGRIKNSIPSVNLEKNIQESLENMHNLREQDLWRFRAYFSEQNFDFDTMYAYISSLLEISETLDHVTFVLDFVLSVLINHAELSYEKLLELVKTAWKGILGGEGERFIIFENLMNSSEEFNLEVEEWIQERFKKKKRLLFDQGMSSIFKMIRFNDFDYDQLKKHFSDEFLLKIFKKSCENSSLKVSASKYFPPMLFKMIQDNITFLKLHNMEIVNGYLGVKSMDVSLEYTDKDENYLKSILRRNLPVQGLIFRNCSFQLSPSNNFKTLQRITITRNPEISDTDLKSLHSALQLKYLNLSHCYNITGSGFFDNQWKCLEELILNHLDLLELSSLIYFVKYSLQTNSLKLVNLEGCLHIADDPRYRYVIQLYQFHCEIKLPENFPEFTLSKKSQRKIDKLLEKLRTNTAPGHRNRKSSRTKSKNLNRYPTTLEYLVENSRAHQLFREYLQRSDASEYLQVYFEILRYEKLPDQELKVESKRIAKLYLGYGLQDSLITINPILRPTLEKMLEENPSREIFSSIKEQICDELEPRYQYFRLENS